MAGRRAPRLRRGLSDAPLDGVESPDRLDQDTFNEAPAESIEMAGYVSPLAAWIVDRRRSAVARLAPDDFCVLSLIHI